MTLPFRTLGVFSTMSGLPIPLSLLERRFLQDESDANRQRGVSLANDICKNYRRDGKFFDEILDAAK